MKKALVIVDIQNDYFPGGKMELAGAEDAAENARRILELFRTMNLPVFHIQHLSKRAGATFFLPDTEGVQIHESVTPQEGEAVIQKYFPNSFRETSLNEQLQRLGVEELVFCGAMTHMCIDTTVRAAFDLGFRCRVVSNACATRELSYGGVTVGASQVQAAFMAALSIPFAQIVEANELEIHLG